MSERFVDCFVGLPAFGEVSLQSTEVLAHRLVRGLQIRGQPLVCVLAQSTLAISQRGLGKQRGVCVRKGQKSGSAVVVSVRIEEPAKRYKRRSLQCTKHCVPEERGLVEEIEDILVAGRGGMRCVPCVKALHRPLRFGSEEFQLVFKLRGN